MKGPLLAVDALIPCSHLCHMWKWPASPSGLCLLPQFNFTPKDGHHLPQVLCKAHAAGLSDGAGKPRDMAVGGYAHTGPHRVML